MPERVIAATIELGRAVPAHGTEVDRLEFREPTGADIAAAGVPCAWSMRDGEAVATYDAPRMSIMMGRLAAVPPSAIERLASHDWMHCAQVVSLFFVPMKAPQTSSTSPST